MNSCNSFVYMNSLIIKALSNLKYHQISANQIYEHVIQICDRDDKMTITKSLTKSAQGLGQGVVLKFCILI